MNNNKIKKNNSVEKKKLPKNLLPKILSVLAAISLWFYVMTAEAPNYEDEFKGISVDLYGANELESTIGLSAIFGADQNINVTLSGKKNLINTLDPDSLYAYVDLNSIKASGRYNLPVYVNVPSGITVVSYYPEEISVYLDKTITKSVPVKTVKSSVSIGAGLSIGTITTDVEYVDVTGPADTVNSVVSANLNLELDKINATTTYTGKLVLADSDGKEISSAFTKINTPTVTATIPIITTKWVTLGVDFTHGYLNSNNSDITISPSKLLVSMPVELENSLETISIATINETHIQNGYSMAYPIQLPNNVTAVSNIETATVNINLKNTETTSYTLDKSKIKAINVPLGYEAEIETNYVTFGARGPKEVITELNVDNFDAVIDLSGHSIEGTSSVAVLLTSKVEGVYSLNIEKLYPMPTVMVKLKKVN